MELLKWLPYYLLLVKCAWCQNVTLTIPLGTLTGRKLTTPKATHYYSFQKVPFAEPPVGHLRFEPPVAKKNSRTVYDNTNDNVMCYQGLGPIPEEYQRLQSEDCLYLSIYTPQLPKHGVLCGLPVLVYFYGGGFIVGATFKSNYGPDFMIDKNIIVVLVNYRVSSFGFLSTNDTVVPGNYGLKDQLLGLQWIHRNIIHFGGNPAKITVGGESGGGASVIYQLMTKRAKGLFRAAISESGSALNPWAYQRNPKSIAFQLAKLIDPTFHSTDSSVIRDFLKGVTAEQLQNGTLRLNNVITLPEQAFNGIAFSPVIEVEHEGAFITQKQYVSLESGAGSRVPLFIGYSAEEVIGLFEDPNVLKAVSLALDANPDLLIPSSLQLKPGVDKAAIAKEIKQIYVPTGNFIDHQGATVRFVSDNTFTRGIIKTAALRSKWSKIYFYEFNYSGQMGGIPVIIEGAGRAGHVAEHNYIWRVTSSTYDNTDLSKFPKDDVRVHYRFLDMFTNFVKNLNPSIREANWPDIRAQGNKGFLYMDVNVTLTVKNQPRANTYPKWNAIYFRDGVQPFTVF